jgi:hypothetical protein
VAGGHVGLSSHISRQKAERMEEDSWLLFIRIYRFYKDFIGLFIGFL